MNKDTQEIVALTEKWLGEIRTLAVGYSKSIATLDEFRRHYEAQNAAQRHSWHSRLLDWIKTLMPVIMLVVAFLVMMILLNFLPCGVEIKLPGGAEIHKSC